MMAKLSEITKGVRVRGIAAPQPPPLKN